MINEKIYLLESQLKNQLLNSDIGTLDLAGFEILLSSIKDAIDDIYEDNIKIFNNTITPTYNPNYIFIEYNNEMLNETLSIFLELENNKIKNIEISINMMEV